MSSAPSTAALACIIGGGMDLVRPLGLATAFAAPW